MAFELSYAGVALGVPGDFVADWSDDMLPADLDAVGPQSYPDTRLGGYGPGKKRKARPGTLYWPTGASRWAVGHFFATAAQLDQIDLAVGRTQSSPGKSATLTMKGATGESITPSMYMLPPRPIACVQPQSPPSGMRWPASVYLITLVDERYWWWATITPNDLVSGLTTWDGAVAAALAALGETITSQSTVSGSWGALPSGLDFSGEPLVLVIDALCYATGLRFSRGTDGIIKVRDYAADRTAHVANLANNWPRWKGGEYRTDPAASPPEVADQPYALPEKARVVFMVGSTANTENNTINASLLGVSPVTTRKDKVRMWTAHRLTYGSAETSYATQFAKAFGLRQLAATETRYAGIKPWNPTGLNDSVEWVWRSEDEERTATVVRRGPFNDGVTELVGPGMAASTSVQILRILGDYITASSIRYYPVDIQSWDSLPSTPPDSGEFAWLAPYYQTAIWGGIPDVYLDTARAYSGISVGASLTATADFGSGAVEKTLPIYWTAFSPSAMTCDEDSPVIAPGTS